MTGVFEFNGNLALESSFLWDTGIIKYDNYKQHKRNGNIKVLRPGKGNGNRAIISYDNLNFNLKQKVDLKLKEIGVAQIIKEDNTESISFFESFIKPDPTAFNFYTTYELEDGRVLKPEVANQYYTNAIVLNAFNEILTLRQGKRNACGISGNKKTDLFGSVLRELKEIDTKKYNHDLPLSERNFRPKFKAYIAGGKRNYETLIHSNYCNQHSRKVNPNLERLLLSIYTKSNNPYGSWVYEDYHKFLQGSLDILDMSTGELFNREEFRNAHGEFIEVSEATVWNYINKPSNRAIVDNLRMGYHQFGSLKRPHYFRSNAKYSLSKVSLDDRDLPRKLNNGKRVKAYYAYDVCSGVLIGASYSIKKDADLFINCIRDMFRNIDKMGLGLPLEMEVENHLVRQFEDDLMKAGMVFPFVRWCAPTNSQEKHAEQFNGQKKYGYEKRYQDGIGRFYAKREANRTNGQRVYNENTDTYEIKEKTYDYDQLVAEDIESMIAYNNGLHRDQKTYKDKTRMQVFLENINPGLTEINRPFLMRYIGNKTITTLNRNQYCQCQYANYQLPSPTVLKRLKPNNYSVTAYWLENASGTIDEIHLFQDEQFICTAAKIEAFTTAQAEWTDSDSLAMTKQSKYIKQFDKITKEGKENLAKVKIIEHKNDIDFNTSDSDSILVAEPVRKEEDYLEYINQQNYSELAHEMA